MTKESGNTPDLDTAFYLSDLSAKDKPWDTHRANSDRVRDLYSETQFSRYAERIELCSRALAFGFKADDLGEVDLKLDTAHFCRVRHCPVCQWRRSLMWRARFFKALPQIQTDYPNASFLFLTLTVRNCQLSELRKTVVAMNKAWKLLTKRKQFPAIGWVKSVEVTRGKDGSAHPHFHVILMVRDSYFKRGYISQANWTELWKDCLKIDYTPVVNIKVVRANRKVSAGQADPGLGIFVALCETLKYSVKEEDLIADPGWLLELTKQLHKTRAIALGGVFKKYLSEIETEEDLIHTDLDTDNPITEDDPRIWFSWREMVKKYAKDGNS